MRVPRVIVLITVSTLLNAMAQHTGGYLSPYQIPKSTSGAKSGARNVTRHGFRVGASAGWIGSYPRGVWLSDITYYMGSVEPQFGNGVNASLLLHIIDNDVEGGVAAIPFADRSRHL